MTEGKHPGGRPTLKTPALVSAIMERLMAGETLRSICRDASMPTRATVYNWLANDREFLDQYTKAREVGLDAMFDEALEIADDGSNDWTENDRGDVVLNSEHVQRSRLRIDTRKWYLARAMPKKYGDRVEQAIVGDPERPLQSEQRIYRYVVVQPQPFSLEGKDET